MNDLANPRTRPGYRRAHVLRPILVFACLPLLLHCGGDDGTGGMVEPTPAPVFRASGTASAPDLVTLAFGENRPGSLIQVKVHLGGPHAASDIFAFAFDLVLSNPSVIRSVTAEVGDALTGQQLLPPPALVGDRLVVGVSKAGGATGDSIGASGAAIVSLVFKMDPTMPGTTTLAFDQQKCIVEGPKVCAQNTALACTIDSDCGAGDLYKGPCQVQRLGITFDSASASIEQPQ